MIQDNKISVLDRIELRRSQRNLDSFLQYNFDSGMKLSILNGKIQSHAVKILQEVDNKKLHRSERLSFWWNGNMDLRKIAGYIEEQAPKWASFLDLDEKKLVHLERQCAILEKKVDKFNKHSSANPIPFVNPLRKSLRVVVEYPFELGRPELAAVDHEIFFNRLTNKKQLEDKIEEVLNLPVAVVIKFKESWNTTPKLIQAFNIVPKLLFKESVQTLPELFNPSDDRKCPKVTVLTVSYSKHDWQTAIMSLLNKRQNETLPYMYQTGFTLGRRFGYNEAIEKVNEIFGTKTFGVL